MRVREASEEPGSLKPTCPSVPMPRICRSTPAGLGDRVLVGRARRSEVVCEAVGPVDRARGEVHPLGDLVLDHVPVALGVLRGRPTYSSSVNALARAKDRPSSTCSRTSSS